MASASAVPVDVISVYDGDTLVVDARPWPGLTVRTRVRIRGIDAPEIRGKCRAEVEAAARARARLAELAGDRVRLEDVRHGKFAGRVIADVITQEGSAAAVLLREGLVRPYDGGRRAGWCE